MMERLAVQRDARQHTHTGAFLESHDVRHIKNTVALSLVNSELRTLNLARAGQWHQPYLLHDH
jgi:ABC-type lipopolysaccharide export system ATPase subunit